MKEKTPKAGGKLPKWVIPVGIAAAIVVVLMLRKKAAASSANATELGSQGLSSQSFIPVTGENVPGVGAGGYGSNSNEGLLTRLFESEQESNKAFQEYTREQNLQTQQNDKENAEAQRNFTTELFRTLGTGGGAPSTGAPGGTIAAPPPPTAPAPAPAPAPPSGAPAGECAPGFPFKGPHGCYRWSRTKSSDGCPCHGYQSGLLVCQHKVKGNCTF